MASGGVSGTPSSRNINDILSSVKGINTSNKDVSDNPSKTMQIPDDLGYGKTPAPEPGGNVKP